MASSPYAGQTLASTSQVDVSQVDRCVLWFKPAAASRRFSCLHLVSLPADSVSTGQRRTGGHQIRGLSLPSHLHDVPTLLVHSVPSLNLDRTSAWRWSQPERHLTQRGRRTEEQQQVPGPETRGRGSAGGLQRWSRASDHQCR